VRSVQGSTAAAGGVGTAAAVPVAAGDGAATVGVPTADVGDGNAAVGVGVSSSSPHAMSVATTAMASAATQM
jgi:hypothetical protein